LGQEGRVSTRALIQRLAAECGFELCGVARAEPHADAAVYMDRIGRGHAGEMRYLTDHRAELRRDPRTLLPSARSIICTGKLYNTPQPYSTEFESEELGWISRYAWGGDYHDVLRNGLRELEKRLTAEFGEFESRICVDTAPLLERSYARDAGLGWIGKNTCLINQQQGSWFFLGELLVSLDLEPDAPPPDRCGSCTRCIDACPTGALIPDGSRYALDARLCISYFTIELRDAVPEAMRRRVTHNVFGCDICQDVCPWNSEAPLTLEPAFQAQRAMPPLDRMAGLTEREFSEMFRGTPVKRARYEGFLRNVAVAMGNSGNPAFRRPLERLAKHSAELVAEHARWALAQMEESCETRT
jgi:epoxyqueuosine reductase